MFWAKRMRNSSPSLWLRIREGSVSARTLTISQPTPPNMQANGRLRYSAPALGGTSSELTSVLTSGKSDIPGRRWTTTCRESPKPNRRAVSSDDSGRAQGSFAKVDRGIESPRRLHIKPTDFFGSGRLPILNSEAGSGPGFLTFTGPRKGEFGGADGGL